MELKIITIEKPIVFDEYMIQLDGIKEKIESISDVEKYILLAYEAGKNGEQLEILQETLYE